MNQARYTSLPKCLVCGAKTHVALDLGAQPLANSLIEHAAAPFHTYPLGLAVCPTCAHAQLTHAVDPTEIFNDYLYASGTSQTLRAFFMWFAEKLVAGVGTQAKVLELASNDGSFLDALRAVGLTASGIDPAQNMCDLARAKGHDVSCGFFPDVRPDTPMDVIVAMNVLAHGPTPQRFMDGIAQALAPGGLALIQTSQANMIANGEFDTIYHEHYSFFSARSMATLAEGAGLVLERVDLVSVHGTSFLFALRKPGERRQIVGPVDFTDQDPFYVAPPDPLPALFDPQCAPEVAAGVYAEFTTSAEKTLRQTADALGAYAAEGKAIGLVGVAAKALTFVHAAEIMPCFFFDEAPLKIGRFVPGAAVPIKALSALADLNEDVVLLIGAWNFATELTQKIRTIISGTPMEHRVTIIVHLPHFQRL